MEDSEVDKPMEPHISDKENLSLSPEKEVEKMETQDDVQPTLEDESSNVTCCWEYEVSAGKFVRYNEDITEKLNEAAPDAVVEVTVEESPLKLDLSLMKQINGITGFRRNFRCVVQTPAEDEFFVWEYMKGRRYTPLPRAVQVLLESGKQKGTLEVTVHMNDVDWKADLENMKLISDESESRLRRSEAVADSSFSALPAPSAERTRTLTRRGAKSVEYKKEPKEEVEEDIPLGEPVKKSRGRKTKKDEDNDDEPPKKKSAAKSGPIKSTKRVVVVKGRAPVDPECEEKVRTAHVLEEGNTVWDAMLNQTNIGNNNNKFYILQLLEDDKEKKYSVWFRWGRVGYRGQSNLFELGGDLEEAKRVFCKKFSDKTHNEWAERHDFERVPGKYTLIEMDHSVPMDKIPTADSEAVKEEEPDADQPVEESKLDDRVASLMALICNIQAMEEAVMEMEYDIARAPLGKITTAQITEGYRLLGVIENFIKEKKFGRDFVDAVNEYYTKIPHSFGFRQPPLIKTEEQLKKESDLLEVLDEIEIAIRTLGEGKRKGDRRAAVDRQYENMKCELRALDENEEEYKLVEKYLTTTHASTHMYKMKIRNVFAVKREAEEGRFKEHLGNRQLLWHGSRLTNWYGILSQGLRIAPPEAPSCGYMFGKGVYFADMASKSGNYCYPSNGNPGILMLAEVALGNQRELRDADYNANRLPPNKHSTFGVGRTQPDPKEHVTLDDGLLVPCGKPVKRTENGPYSLLYNEYIVYDTDQIRMKYAVELEFAM